MPINMICRFPYQKSTASDRWRGGEILVGNGDRVSVGNVLIRLDATQTQANLAVVTKRVDEMTARLERLEAERDDKPEIEFPTSLPVRQEASDVEAALHSERQLFQLRRESREGRKAQIRERIAQYKNEINGLKARELAYDRGLTVLEREIGSLRALWKKGVVNTQRLNSLEAQAATVGGERGEKIAFHAQVAGRLSETRLQILSIDQDLKTEVGQELRDTSAAWRVC